MKKLGLRSALIVVPAIPALARVATSQYDNSRTGGTRSEKILTPPNVNARGTHDVIFIATEHAFDAERLGEPIHMSERNSARDGDSFRGFGRRQQTPLLRSSRRSPSSRSFPGTDDVSEAASRCTLFCQGRVHHDT